MLTLHKLIPQGRGLAPVLVKRAASVELDWDVRQKSRLGATDSQGRAIGVFLPRGTLLRGGDVLVAEDGSLIRVIAAPQAVLRITPCAVHGSPFDLTRAAYHLGNRHVPIELTPEHLQIEPDHVLADSCPNLIGFKDGFGDIEKFVSIRQTLGDRFAYLGGLPTAELFAGAYKAMGCPVYSSAVFNFIPKTAMEFYNAHAANDTETCNRLIRDFFIPYIALRNQGEGYAVSIVKAGATISGHSAGPVRPPLSDLKPEEFEQLRALMAPLGPQ